MKIKRVRKDSLMTDVFRMLGDFLFIEILLFAGVFVCLLPIGKQDQKVEIETQFLQPNIPPFCVRCATPIGLNISSEEINNIAPRADESDIAWFMSSKFSPLTDMTLKPKLDNKILPSVTVAKFHVHSDKIFGVDHQYRQEGFLLFFTLCKRCYQKGKTVEAVMNNVGYAVGILLTFAFFGFLVKWIVLDQLPILNSLVVACLLPFSILGGVIGTMFLASKKSGLYSAFILVKGWLIKDEVSKKHDVSADEISDIIADRLTYQFSNKNFAAKFRESNVEILLSG